MTLPTQEELEQAFTLITEAGEGIDIGPQRSQRPELLAAAHTIVRYAAYMRETIQLMQQNQELTEIVGRFDKLVAEVKGLQSVESQPPSKDTPLQPESGAQRIDFRPASTLVPLYESRLSIAEANLNYWNDQYACHRDPIAKAAWHSATKTVGDIVQKLIALKQPGTVVLGSA
jgi:hypothetical protein